MSWFKRTTQNIEAPINVKSMPDGLWTKCPSCGEVIYKTQLEESMFTCPTCSNHFRISSKEYIKIIFDSDTFVETNEKVRSGDPLSFTDTKPYKQRLAAAYSTSEFNDALTTGYGNIHGLTISFACMNFSFIGGSMGSVVGEKFVRAAHWAIENKTAFVVLSASGGARMQEAALSLMQMAKTSVALAQLSEAGLPYISVLTDPTTGGVSASYAMLGDYIIAEPKALIGFAGPRVIEQTIKKKLPEGFQSSEFLLKHGFLDKIVDRKNLKNTLHSLITWSTH